MRFVVAALLVTLAAAFPHKDHKFTDKEFIHHQEDILRLFKYVHQPSYYKDHVEISKKFHLHEHYEDYTKPEVAKHYHKIFQYGLLPRGEIFSVFYDEHLQQAIALYKLFYYAKDYQTFYETAAWARQRVNQGVFLYALSVAIVHRHDTYGIVIPPIYEIYPYYFYNAEVIQKAYKFKQLHYGQQHDQDHENYYTITANYSGKYLNLNPEQSLSYFTEDIGINSFYYYFHIYYPHWLGGEEFDFKHDRRGEYYIHFYQQFLARYYLERLSNGFGEIPFFNWEVPFETGYHSSLQYPCGLFFPERPNFAHLYEYFYNYGEKYGNSRYAYSYTFVQDYERRLRDAVDKGFVFSHDGKKISLYSDEGLNIFGNLIQSNPDSPDHHYYGALHVYARHLLGYSKTPLTKYQVAPSALEHYETSARDPAFYQLYKRLGLLYQKYRARLHPYTEEDLHFPGVEVKNVECDRLITYFDSFYSDITNALYVTPQEFESDKVQVRVKQQRLNHKPFSYKVHVHSDKEQEAVVRVFIGPKHDEYGRHINISQNSQNFVHLDTFKYQLKSGDNQIERHSHEFPHYYEDRTSYKQLYKRVLEAASGTGDFHVYSYDVYYRFPQRFLLPVGSYEGFEYQFYFIVTPFKPYEGHAEHHESPVYFYPKVGTGDKYIDGYPLGYPFDRPIHYGQIFHNIKNSYSYTAKIYHRHADEINASTAHH